MPADPSVSPADTIPYDDLRDDLRFEVEAAVERGDEYHPVSVASLIELLDAYSERDALLAVWERREQHIDRLTEAVEVTLAMGPLDPEFEAMLRAALADKEDAE